MAYAAYVMLLCCWGKGRLSLSFYSAGKSKVAIWLYGIKFWDSRFRACSLGSAAISLHE